MLAMTSVVPARVLAASQKGGVGKTSLIANVAVAIANAGKRVLVVDCDQQATLTKIDLGVPDDYWDKGQSLATAMQYGSELTPVTKMRPNLDVVCGGPHLALVTAAAEAAATAGINLGQNLAQALDKVCRRAPYDIVLVDSGPGDSIRILQPLLEICTHLVVPTKEDDGSIDGVTNLAARYRQARRNGSQIRLLGVVLFDVNPRATKRNENTFRKIADLLEGSGAETFEAIIRTDKATANDQRERHLTAQELAGISGSETSTFLSALRNGRTGEVQRMWSRDPVGLANDYQNLTREILVRVSKSPVTAQ